MIYGKITAAELGLAFEYADSIAEENCRAPDQGLTLPAQDISVSRSTTTTTGEGYTTTQIEYCVTITEFVSEKKPVAVPQPCEGIEEMHAVRTRQRTNELRGKSNKK